MTRKDYERARDLAWRTLLRFGVCELPVRRSHGIRKMGIALIPYSAAGDLLCSFGLDWIMRENDGLSLKRSGRYYIFYRGICPPEEYASQSRS